MSYIEENLLPGESVTHTARLHFAIFIAPVVILALYFVLTVVAVGAMEKAAPAVRHGVILCLLPLVPIALAWFMSAFVRRWTTEMAVTNRRVLLKTGLIARRTLELRLEKVETVAIDQGLLGRLLDYGMLTVIGTGGSREAFAAVADPVGFRNAVNAQTDEQRS